MGPPDQPQKGNMMEENKMPVTPPTSTTKKDDKFQENEVQKIQKETNPNLNWEGTQINGREDGINKDGDTVM